MTPAYQSPAVTMYTGHVLEVLLPMAEVSSAKTPGPVLRGGRCWSGTVGHRGGRNRWRR